MPTPPADHHRGPPGRRALVVAVALFALSAVVVPLVVLARLDGPVSSPERTLSEVLAAIDGRTLDGRPVTGAGVDDDARAVTLSVDGGPDVTTHYPGDFAGTLISRLEASGLPFSTAAPSSPSLLTPVALTLLPVLLLIAFLAFFMRRNNVGAAGAKAFTAAQSIDEAIPATRFTDVVGCDEAVEELAEVVAFLHDPARFDAAGARLPKGFLLVGPPGTGKTLLARAVAGEAGVPFYAAAGSDFTEMFVGVGAARVRNLFTKAKKTGGIVFVDEIDSVGRARTGSRPGGGSDEQEGTLNALLVEMDGFGTDHTVVVIAATNRPDILDPALLRAGRFDRRVTVAAPDRRGRTRLLALYTATRRVAADVDLVTLARRMPGLTGADVENVVNQAALEAARAGRGEIQAADFDEALATVMMGRARRSAVVTDEDREVTAWHEAGHAVAALVLPDAHDPVQVTIVPRGPSGGATWMGGDDHTFLTRTRTRARLTVSLAGRAAEELLLDGDFTQGASGDLVAATALATRMVTEWGMSSLGLAAMGPELAEPGVVRGEVDRILADALVAARRLLAQEEPLLRAVVAELLDDETIDGSRLAALRAGLAAA